ncbi:retropepsins domain protein, putative [Medicago truncatula]|uniref:Retropepsins domain protein, putative n=1 Tax=Medicago truncatula TaxID=3880 RepID=A0A072V9B9_MEDTR|nr:retropepsins domain protein, putative [Medicago truncatula]
MYEISTLDHLAVKVDALTQKFDKMNTSAITPALVSPPCEVWGVFFHIGVDCQLSSAIEGVEQMNYAQYNQGMRQKQNFYKTPQNSYGQTTPPGWLCKQPESPSKLQELKNQTEFLNDSLAKLKTKVDSITTHNKMLETQISQMAASSKTTGVFLGQTEINPKAHINAITLEDGKQLEYPVLKVKNKEGEIESDKPLSSFSIPCVIGSETIDKAICDLGASVRLLPLSLFKRMGIGKLKPIETTLKLADRSTIRPVRFVEDIPVKIEGIYIPADFMVVDIEEDPDVHVLLGRIFLATWHPKSQNELLLLFNRKQSLIRSEKC